MEEILLETYKYVNKINYSSENEIKKILLFHYWVHLQGDITIQINNYNNFKEFLKSLSNNQLMNILDKYIN